MFSYIAAKQLPEEELMAEEDAFGVIIAYHRLEHFNVNCISAVVQDSDARIVRRVANVQGMSVRVDDVFFFGGTSEFIENIVNRLSKLGIWDLPSLIEGGQACLGGETIYIQVKIAEGKQKKIMIQDPDNIGRKYKPLMSCLRTLAMASLWRLRISLFAFNVGFGNQFV